jgi:hypothetical protein
MTYIPIVLVAATACPAACAADGALSVRVVEEDAVQLEAAGQSYNVSLHSPVFVLGDGDATASVSSAETRGALDDDQGLRVVFPAIEVGAARHLEVELNVRWSETEHVLRKQARLRLNGTSEAVLLKEVVLERIDISATPTWTHGTGTPGSESPLILDGPQSHPVFMPGLFVGIEYPVSATRCEDGHIVLAHQPGVSMQPGVWYETRTAIYGLAQHGQEVRAFRDYIAAHRPAPKVCHFNYNSWWTSPVPYSEGDILRLMEFFERELHERHGVSLDTFCIDLGWSDPKSIWQIDRGRFPDGFARISDAARKLNARLGLWISPSSFYPPALDSAWAAEQGYETYVVSGHGTPDAKHQLLCLGGRRYAEQFAARLADLVGRWDIHHLKFDGCNLRCPEVGHGHEPGTLSSEAIAEGVIAAARAARAADAEVWIETTCFGYNPSPWWLLYVNSVIGTFGDDAPVGRVPSPVYRESYTTARDFFNLQGASLLPIPAAAQEVLGIIHQTADSFMNDAVVTVMRGHQFLPLYVNPKFMDEARWQALAGLLQWTRANADTLSDTVTLLPRSWQDGKTPRFRDEGTMPREPYGYAHLRNGEGVLCLRNPWIASSTYAITLDQALGYSPAAASVSAISLYPEPRVYGDNLQCGGTLEVPLAPYETLVLSLRRAPIPPELPRASDSVGHHVAVTNPQCRVERVAFEGGQSAQGPNWICRLGDSSGAIRVRAQGTVTVNAPSAELLVLCEGAAPPPEPTGTVKVNGAVVTTSSLGSASGWSATLLPSHEHWRFLRAPLNAGSSTLDVDLLAGEGCTSVSAWICASRPGAAHPVPGAIPPPPTVSVDGASLIAEQVVAELAPPASTMDRPVEHIQGVFLDAIEPTSVTQGWGSLQKNRSVWEKPMVIGGRRFLRGLGVHAPAKAVFALDGKYRRFQSWVGPDGNTYPTVTFEVHVDGVPRWQSGLMTRDSAALWVDIDVSGAKILELIVGDHGDLAADHADWAEARLLE